MTETTEEPRRSTDPVGAVLCLLAFVLLLVALALGELQQWRVQTAHELLLLRRDAHHLLDRPNLLWTESFDLLEALSQDADRLARRLADDATIPVDEADRAGLALAAANLSRLAGQRKAFANLGQLAEQLTETGGAAAVPRASPLWCGDDVTVANMPLLRSVIDSRLSPGKAVDAGPRLLASGAAATPQLQRALQAVDEFRSLRGQVLAALDRPSLSAPVGSVAMAQRATAAVAGLLALLAAWRWNRQRLRADGRPGAASLRAIQPVDWAGIPVLSLASVVLDPLERVEQAAANRLQQDEQWQDLRRAVIAAFDSSCLLERYASNLVDSAQDGDDQVNDEVLRHLGPLADSLLTAREGALNLGLSLLPEAPGQASPVVAMARLDQQLVAILDDLSRLEQLRSIDALRATHTAQVPRHALVHLQSELQHLSRQLATLHNDVVDGHDADAAALPALAADR